MIRSLTLRSNKRIFGPFGVEDGKAFSFAIEEGLSVVGLVGRSVWYLETIGIRLSRAQCQSQDQDQLDQSSQTSTNYHFQNVVVFGNVTFRS